MANGVEMTIVNGANHTKVTFSDGRYTVVARHNEMSRPPGPDVKPPITRAIWCTDFATTRV